MVEGAVVKDVEISRSLSLTCNMLK